MSSTDSRDEIKLDDANAKQNSSAALESFVDRFTPLTLKRHRRIVLYLFSIVA
jgi:hypothetical protein